MTATPLGSALVALLIGLLFGLERQHSQAGEGGLFAGIRTFPVLSLMGFAAATVGQKGLPLLLPALLLAVGGLAVASYLRTSGKHRGATTEAVALLAPLLGALAGEGDAELAGALAVVVTLLLTLKAPLHRIAGTVSEEEILAILKFAVVGVILLPLLPTSPVGPYGAIVPRHVGIVVLTISGVSLLGYVLVRTLGGRAGWPLAGLTGGFVSSTAVTLAFSGKARALPDVQRPLAVGLILASTILYLRGLFLVFVFDRTLAVYLAPRLIGLFVLGLALAAFHFRKGTAGKGKGEAVGLGNPVELGRAFGLGALFAVILVAARAAEAYLGTGGLWAAGAVGGLVDVDSVAVAAARLRQQGLVDASAAGGSFLLASVTNALVKGGIVAVVGGRGLARLVLPAFALLVAATLGVLAVG